MRVQFPFESERVHSRAVGGAAFLNDEKCRNNIHRVLQAAAEKSGTVGRSENQTVAQAEIPDSVAGLTSIGAVASPGPDLEFVSALDGARLRARSRNVIKGNEKDDGDGSIQRQVSSAVFDSPRAAWDADEDIEFLPERRISSSSFEVGADDLDDVVGGFFGRFGIARHVVANMVFHQLGNKTVDGAASGSEALEGVGAGLVFVECTKDAFELADDFLGAVDEVEFFSRGM